MSDIKFNLPTTKVVNICDAERFAIGLKQLATECNVSSWSMLQTEFKDGTSIGNGRLMKYALGHISSLNSD